MSLQAACSRQEKGLADRPGQVCLKAVKEGPIRCATARRATRWHVPELDDRGPRRYPDCFAHRLCETAIKAASVGGLFSLVPTRARRWRFWRTRKCSIQRCRCMLSRVERGRTNARRQDHRLMGPVEPARALELPGQSPE